MTAEIPFHKSGALGWTILAGGVLAWDVTAPETLSAAFRRSRKHPVGKIAVNLSWMLLTAHLIGAIPERIDPIHRSGVELRKIVYKSYGKRTLPALRS